MSKEVKRWVVRTSGLDGVMPVNEFYTGRDQQYVLASDYEALLAERDALKKDAERWRPLSAPGQIKAGDWLSFTVGGKFKCARVKEVLRPGSDREEVIWNRRKNFYFVTRMALDGSSNHKRVMIAALQGAQP